MGIHRPNLVSIQNRVHPKKKRNLKNLKKRLVLAICVLFSGSSCTKLWLISSKWIITNWNKLYIRSLDKTSLFCAVNLSSGLHIVKWQADSLRTRSSFLMTWFLWVKGISKVLSIVVKARTRRLVLARIVLGLTFFFFHNDVDMLCFSASGKRRVSFLGV